MPKSVKRQRPAERPEDGITSMERLLQIKSTAQPLHVKISIPGEVVPLFKAIGDLLGLSVEATAVWAICKGLTCETAMDAFDERVNELLH